MAKKNKKAKNESYNLNEIDEQVILEEDGYVLTETPSGDDFSLYVVYDDKWNYLGDFDDKALTENEKLRIKDTSVYKEFRKIVDNSSKDDDWLDDEYFLSYGYGDYSYKQKEKSPEEIEAEKKRERELIESLCKSDTLVIHLSDPTTRMLDIIYEGRGWDEYHDSSWRGGLSKEGIHELIKRHDKILCLGHGSPSGLIGGNIGVDEVPLLKEKKVFALWCFAATFFKRNGFEGYGVFCSDNCPSEVHECRYACNAEVSAEWIYNNMVYLSECLRDVIDITWDNPQEACRRAREAYHKSYDTCETDDERAVVEFNTNTLQVV